MIAPILLTLVAPAAAGDVSEQVSGRCSYNASVLEHRGNATLILCDRLEVDRASGAVSMVFRQSDWDAATTFAGTMEGDRLRVTYLTLRDGSQGAAKGTCEIRRVQGSISAASCLATLKGRAVIAHFDISRVQH